MDNELLVKTIRTLCKDNNISISQLENDLNFGAGLISRWVKSSPSLDKIIDIANYFHVSIDEVVGYKQNINDDFLQLLYDKTNNKSIKWLSYKEIEKMGYKPKRFDMDCDEDEYLEDNYYFLYGDGYIVFYAMYCFFDIISPKSLSIFIQPSDKSDLIEQKYKKEDLLKLWIKILNSLEEIPDEIKAENLKNKFIDEFSIKMNNGKNIRKVNKRKITCIKKTINKIVNINGSLLYDIDNDIILYKNEADGVTYTGKRFYFNYKEEMGQIYQAQMIDGDKLILISYSHIMKLSGFSCGEKCGLTGYNGLIEILSDVGFDISDKSIFNRENFVVFIK